MKSLVLRTEVNEEHLESVWTAPSWSLLDTSIEYESESETPLSLRPGQTVLTLATVTHYGGFYSCPQLRGQVRTGAESPAHVAPGAGLFLPGASLFSHSHDIIIRPQFGSPSYHPSTFWFSKYKFFGTLFNFPRVLVLLACHNDNVITRTLNHELRLCEANWWVQFLLTGAEFSEIHRSLASWTGVLYCIPLLSVSKIAT